MGFRRHLFVAIGAGFGEMTLGIRLAHELHQGGDEVLFLAAAQHAPLLRGTPFRHGAIDGVLDILHEALPAVVEQKRCDCIVLVDLTSFALWASLRRGVDPTVIERLPVPLAALDIWNLAEAGLVWDTGDGVLPLHPVVAGVKRRLVPVPFARPEAAGAYDAWDPAAPPGAEVRAARRAELGLTDGDRLIVLTTSRWQARPARPSPYHERLVELGPALLARALARVPARVLHIGPQPLPLGERSLYEPPQSAERFRATVAAADLFLTLNHAASTITTALALGVPALAVVSSAPAHPFRVWPLGLSRFLAPVLDGNPYAEVVAAVELDDEDALVAALAGHTVDPDALRAYREQVRALPSGAARLASLW